MVRIFRQTVRYRSDFFRRSFLLAGGFLIPHRRPWVAAALFALSLVGANVAAQESQARRGVLEEIIVTAEKRAESLQDLSQAVSTLSDEDMDFRNVESFVDLSGIAPGVTVAKNEGFKTVISIRGVGNEANQNASANPSVSYHLDGIYVASPFALHTGFLDVERVEVLRGPQGTLFGQNSTAGAINVITAAPSTAGFEGNAAVALGSYDLLETRAWMNVPLSDTAAARLAVSSNRHDGYAKNIVRDEQLDEADDLSARLRLLWMPTDTVSVHLTALAFSENTNGAAQKGILDPTPDVRELAQDSRNRYDLDSRLTSLVVEWDAPAVTVKSLTSYQSDKIVVIRDNDRNDFATLIGQGTFLLPSIFDPEINDQTTFTQEVNFVSSEPLAGAWDWVAGIFFLHTEVDILIREYLDFNTDGVFDATTATREQVLNFMGEAGFISDSNPARDSLSIYGQGTYSFGDRARLVSGLRFTNDEVHSEVTNFFGRPPGTQILETESRKTTGRLVLEYDLSSDAMVYGAYTHGFKPGGSNLTFGREDVIAPKLVLPTFQEETVDAYELGVKADVGGARGRINAAVFRYDYKNLQFQATDPEVFEGGVGNIPASLVYGAELEATALLTESFTVDARFAWLETEIVDRFNALDNVRSDDATNALLVMGESLFGPAIQRARAAQIIDVQGNRLAKSPRFTADVMLRYYGRLTPSMDLDAGLRYAYRGEFQHRLFNNPRTDEVPAYGVWDVVVRIGHLSANWHIDLIAANLTDEHGVNARFTDVFGVGATSEELIAPRRYMVRFGVEF